MRLSAHLKWLESESIHIFREVAVEFECQGRMINHDQSCSVEKKKREGYF